MTARQSSLADLANAFGRCALAARDTVARTRLRKIARLMDRLARQPASRRWHRRVALVHREIECALRGEKIRATPGTIWAAD